VVGTNIFFSNKKPLKVKNLTFMSSTYLQSLIYHIMDSRAFIVNYNIETTLLNYNLEYLDATIFLKKIICLNIYYEKHGGSHSLKKKKNIGRHLYIIL